MNKIGSKQTALLAVLGAFLLFVSISGCAATQATRPDTYEVRCPKCLKYQYIPVPLPQNGLLPRVRCRHCEYQWRADLTLIS